MGLAVCFFYFVQGRCLTYAISGQSRQPIQVLEEARDAVQTIHISSNTITTGSVDGHVRTYDLRKGELRSDFIGRKSGIDFKFIFSIIS